MKPIELSHTVIITENFPRLTEFYQDVLQVEPVGSGGWIEFPTPVGTLALFSKKGKDKLAPGAMEGASNRTVSILFRVQSAKAEYERLQRFDIDWVKPPTTQPWGTTSIYFRDPDGNMVNFQSGTVKR